MRYLIIPHLEPCISPWLYSEYRFVTELFRGLGIEVVFTNVVRSEDINLLRRLSTHTYVMDFNSFIMSTGIKDVIVLDPQASRELTPSDTEHAEAAIIGGIMGDNPPRGRTKELITNRVKALNIMPRNLGREQLTIAGAAYVLKRIIEGCNLSDIEFVKGLTIKVRLDRRTELSIELPYLFPTDNGKPVIPHDYIEVVKGATYFEGVRLSRCLDEGSR